MLEHARSAIINRFAMALALGTVLLGTSSCLCPPCGTEAESVEVVPPGSRLILWNGDDVKGTGQSWTECDSKPKCEIKAGLVEKEGIDGSGALRIRAKGGGWMGGGWNFFGWWPENAGYDFSQFDDLVFSVRADAKDKKLLPEPNGMTVGLRCSNGKKSSPFASVGARAKTLADGKWHRVSIPMSEFRKGKEGKAFDMKTVWEFAFSFWHENKREFDVYIDDIAVEKRL